MFSLRIASFQDVPELQCLIEDSARGLCKGDYTPEQIDAALGSAWGVDTMLISDETYFVAEVAGEIAACGGWSFRKALFGADSLTGREPERLDPAVDAARIRAFFVRSQWSRQGIGKALLQRCESEASAAGFKALELVATCTGKRLYETYGFVPSDPIQHLLRDGLTIEFIPMRKYLP